MKYSGIHGNSTPRRNFTSSPTAVEVIDGMQMEQVIDLQSGGELRQDVVRNDRFSLGGIALEGEEGEGVQVSKGGEHVSIPHNNHKVRYFILSLFF